MEIKEIRIAKIILEKNKVGGISLPHFMTYYIATIIDTVWYHWRDRHTGQWNKIENLEIVPQKYVQVIFSQWCKSCLFNKWCWGKWTSIGKTMNLNLSFASYTNVSSRWMTDLNVTCKT